MIRGKSRSIESLIKHKYPSGYGGRDAVYRTIEKPAATSQHARVNIYHVHGFLRFDHRIKRPDKESVSLVLSEDEYFDFFNAPTELFTYAFLARLRENPCLFIGLSMVDDNLRRLLHYSKQERAASYMKERKDKRRAERRSTRHYAILRDRHTDLAAKENDIWKAAMADTLGSLGVRVIWITDYSEIVHELQTLYESTNEHAWDSVY
jgi:hypothetical protein